MSTLSEKRMEEYFNEQFINHFASMSGSIHDNAAVHGWWEEPREDGTLIALIMSEAAEALEALRKGNGPDEHCPQFSGAEVELADVIIRAEQAEADVARLNKERDWLADKCAMHCHDKDRDDILCSYDSCDISSLTCFGASGCDWIEAARRAVAAGEE